MIRVLKEVSVRKKARMKKFRFFGKNSAKKQLSDIDFKISDIGLKLSTTDIIDRVF